MGDIWPLPGPRRVVKVQSLMMPFPLNACSECGELWEDGDPEIHKPHCGGRAMTTRDEARRVTAPMMEPRIRTSLNRTPSGPTSHAEMRAWAAAAYHRGKGDDCWVAIYLGDVRSPVERAIVDAAGAMQYGKRAG